MKKDSCELVFIVDKSGSMSGLESDTIGGFNANLKARKDLGVEVRITTVLFSNEYELLHDRLDIQAVSPLTEKEYQVGGGTALLDAVGKTIHKIRKVQKQTKEEFRSEKVIFVIITDGDENSSHKYSYENIKMLIEHQREKHGWEFVFLGANVDAFTEARKLGISRDNAAEFAANHIGVGNAWAASTVFTGFLRQGKKVRLEDILSSK